MTESPARRVLVVGAGIAGGVLSLALRRQGIDVVVVDLRSELAGVGHGITLQGNALKAFKQVGVYDRIARGGFGFDKLRLRTVDGHVIAEIPTPPLGGPEVPPTMGALRGDVAAAIADAMVETGVDIRLRTTVTDIDDRGDSVVVTLSDGSTETVDLVVGADGIRSQVRGMIGIDAEPFSSGLGIWRAIAERPAEMECSEMYLGGPKPGALYTPISDELCYLVLLEEPLDRSYLGERPDGHELKERGAAYGGTWGKVRDSLADDAVVNYQWIEAVRIEGPWYRGRTLLIGDAAHACPPTVAQGGAMCAEDGVVLAEELAAAETVEAALEAFTARRTPRVNLVLDASLQLAAWNVTPPESPAAPGQLMGQTLGALCAPA
jgi:2-polyprenyl-6-methoxyphenol hydroxylase-like FAD-dependent oxidoreductase